jgi:hypothetical protein
MRFFLRHPHLIRPIQRVDDDQATSVGERVSEGGGQGYSRSSGESDDACLTPSHIVLGLLGRHMSYLREYECEADEKYLIGVV